jgi:Ca-activated chloride channel family protein
MATVFWATLGAPCASLLAQTATGQQARGTPPVLTVEKQVVLLPETTTSDLAIDPRGLSVVFDGRPQEVVSVGLSREWRTVIYLDPALSTPDGIVGSIAALVESAPRLTEIGTVEIVVADPFTETYLEATRDTEELQETLDELEELADAAGEILALRGEIVDAVTDSGLSAESRLLALQEEAELLQESRLELLRWISDRTPKGPTCLILIQDGFDLGAEFAKQLTAELSDVFVETLAQTTQAHGRLAATLASAGWTVLPMGLETAQSDLLPGRSETLTLLADSTGGSLVVHTEELGPVLQQLGNALVVTARVASIPDGIPRPFEVRISSSASTFKTPRWASIGTPIGLSDIRTLQTLEEADLLVGPLSTTGIIRPDAEAAPQPEGFPGVLEAMTDLDRLDRRDPVFRISLLLIQVDGPPQSVHDLVAPGDLGTADAWLYRHRLLLTDNLAAGAIVVEELKSGLWGSSPLELAEQGLPTVGRNVAVWDAPEISRRPPTTIARGAPAEQAVIRVLPPKRRPVVGKTRFQTLVSSPIITRVAFLLDGKEVGTDDKAPYSASLDLGPEVEMHRVGVVAFAANGARLGSHEITVNPRDDSFQVRITEIASPLGGIQNVTAEVSIPRESELDRVEFYWNETLVETLQQAPFQIELPTPDPGAQAFVRVAAYLTDGTWIDDAQLLGEGSISERVEVNLVELHVVVTDRDNKPVEGLDTGDFTVRLGRQEQEIQRLGFAEDVPLTLGVVIDTSESMYTLMVETQQAGAQFVANTLTDGDAAFLVDFDTQPRLAQDTTTDLMTLLKTFSRFQPDGATAMYDAIIFSMLQFEERAGRKALVLLTDGDDYKSRYGPRRCIQYGKRLGVPVYILSLAGIHNARRNLRRIDLEGITEGTGGQVFYIKELGELTDAYSQINQELRSQYIITFATDRELGEIELEEIKVEVEGKGLSVRGVVGGQRVQ